MSDKNIRLFTYEERNSWRNVPLKYVIIAANKCCRGVDFQGSSKSNIYDSISGICKMLQREKRRPHLFVGMMNAMSKEMRTRAREEKTVMEIIMSNELAKEAARMERHPYIPNKPTACSNRYCAYCDGSGICDSPNLNRGNSDAGCYGLSKVQTAKMLDP